MSDSIAICRSRLATRVSVVVPCYRDAHRAIALVNALLLQRSGCDGTPQIIIVDDGSDDGSAARVSESVAGAATIVALASNVGRAAARNAGAQMASGDVLLFLDCDCLPAGDDLIGQHLSAWSHDTVASTGPVLGIQDGFWARYQHATAERMARRVAAGEAFAATAANLMVDRRVFQSCGGFDAAYRGYGFEDRDLLLRLRDHGRVAWSEDAAVVHEAELQMSTVAGKLAEAGQHTAPLFRARYPHAYRRLSYAALDATLSPWLRPLARVLGPGAMWCAKHMDATLETNWIPYQLRALCVRTVSALAYSYGTTRGRRTS